MKKLYQRFTKHHPAVRHRICRYYLMTMRQIIQETIHKEGAIPFEKFMNMALYHPDNGYYSANRNPIGSTGDFYTMPHLTPVFGAMIARQLKEMWEILGQPERFTVVEVGAGNGQFCRSIFQYLENEKDFRSAMEYTIVEKSITMRERAKRIVPSAVTFFEEVNELSNFTGCVISNELFDNIPFSILTMRHDLMEVWVDCDLEFFETLKPATQKIKKKFERLNITIPENGRLEFSLDSLELIGKIASRLQKGFILTIDYGYIKGDISGSSILSGTLTCFHQHRIYYNPYVHIGEQDITAHVNFSALTHFGKAHKLEFAGYSCLGNFLRSLGLAHYLANQESMTCSEQQTAIRFVADLLLNKSGNKFKVLIQYKGIPAPYLTGMALKMPVIL